jgi:hypothetical protein
MDPPNDAANDVEIRLRYDYSKFEGSADGSPT